MTTLPLSLDLKIANPGLAGVLATTGAGNETRTRDQNLGKFVV
jgi:hypothetical protein